MTAPDSTGASRVAAGILASRILGFVRMRVFAHFIGAAGAADAFTMALRVPNVLQNLLGEGTLSASVIPVYAEFVARGEEGKARRFAGAVLGLLLVFSAAVALAGVWLAPRFVPWLVPAFTPEYQALTVQLFRIMLPMMAVMLVSAWAVAILNVHRRFFISYVAPVFWNTAMISAMVGGALVWGMGADDLVVALAWGALVGGVLQVGFQLPFLARALRGMRLSVDRRTEGLREAAGNFVPVVAARGVVNLSGLLDIWLAGLLATGAATMLSFAYAIYILPISLFGMSVAAAELPELAERRGEGGALIARRVSAAMEQLGFFIVPSALAFLFLGGEIIGLIYQTGEFGSDNTTVTWAVLAAYALGLLASSRSRLLSSAFYALRRADTPAKVAYLRVFLSALVGVPLMFLFDRYGVGSVRFGAVGLGLGASVGAWVEFALLTRALRGHVGPHGAERGRSVRVVAAGVGAVVVGVAMLWTLPNAAEMALPWVPGEVVHGLGTLIPFGVAYLGLAHLLGVADPLRRALGAGSGQTPR